ncbi:lactonase, 7-bladed beta-propeller [mine drainage metagenome]|uniref:Lactonase, 7-bladed beta-propeller n=1 Tax=mine drainage metagenome TaxID=410659 RepID=A0A1J5QJV1_9ZZZZ
MKIQPMALVIAAACAALSGCGGGGSSTPSSNTNTGANTGANTPASYAVGGSVSGLLSGETVQLLNNGSDPLTVNADGSFTFATQLAAGSPYNVTVGTQPGGASCSVSAGSGTVASAVSNVAVTCSPVLMKNIALFLDSAGGTILTYAYDAASGQLTGLAGPDVSAGAGSNRILVDASATHVYTLTPGSGTGAPPRLAAFKVGLGGVLTATSGVQTLAANGLDAVLDVAGQNAYVLQAPVSPGGATTIMTYPIDPSTGAINAKVGTPVVLTPTTTRIYRSPGADYLYALDPVDKTQPGTVTALAIGANSTNTTTLQPTAVSVAVPTGTLPVDMAFTPKGEFAYVLNRGSDTVSIYTISTDGSLTPLSPNPTFTPTLDGSLPNTAVLVSMTIDPSGQ